MMKKERLLRAFQNQEVDRVPMGFWYHFSPDDDFGQKTVDQHLELFRETGMDMIKVMCDGYFNYPNPYIEKVTCPEDWLGLTPLGEDHPYIANQVLRAKRVVEGAKGECCVFYNVFCPMSLMRFGTREDLCCFFRAQRGTPDEPSQGESGSSVPCFPGHCGGYQDPGAETDH